MRIVLQRVLSAGVSVKGTPVSEIGTGYLLLVGIQIGEEEQTVLNMARKVLSLRLMPDERGKMNRSVTEAKGEILCVSQFTLFAEMKGRRPGFASAEEPERARVLFDLFVSELQKSSLKVLTGSFGEYMEVRLVNDGPVTIVLE
jgi:D-aminoacyl-tRNA deacylase